MATIGKDRNGHKRILFLDNDKKGKKRKTLRLGKVNRRQAEQVKVHVEALLSARRQGTTIDDRTADWLNDLETSFKLKLAKLGLIDSPDQDELGSFLGSYLKKRQTLVDAGKLSKSTFGLDKLTADCLCDFFGNDKPLRDLSEGDAWDFRNWLLSSGGRPVKRCGPETVVRERKPLDEPTVRKRCSIASKFFNDAARRDLIRNNPFKSVPKGNLASKKLTYINEVDAHKVLDELPTTEWKLLFALARWGGLRVGSEVRRLRWMNIDWQNQKILVHSEKTKHHEGRETRHVPIFPELAPLLHKRREEASDSATLVLPMLAGRSDASLRDPLIRAIQSGWFERLAASLAQPEGVKANRITRCLETKARLRVARQYSKGCSQTL